MSAFERKSGLIHRHLRRINLTTSNYHLIRVITDSRLSINKLSKIMSLIRVLLLFLFFFYFYAVSSGSDDRKKKKYDRVFFSLCTQETPGFFSCSRASFHLKPKLALNPFRRWERQLNILPYLFVFFIGLFGDQLSLKQLGFQYANPVIFHVCFVFESFPYSAETMVSPRLDKNSFRKIR